ncbi:gustatory receptor 61a [Haematobia irritans]|uniref:gustatory receptor 61a n=1 Tax=Haematobia irritans TaxID=7368 RepID=UPI003F4F4035
MYSDTITMPFAQQHWNIWNKLKLRRHQRQIFLRKFAKLHKRQEFSSLDLFHRAIKPCLLLGHIFGLMPLVNTLGDNPYTVEFKIPSLTFTASFLFMIFGSWKIIHVSVAMLTNGITPKNVIGMVFLFMCLSIFVKFLNLAKYWPELLRHWTRIDLMFLMPPYPQPTWTLQKQLRTLTCTFWIAALVENSLYYASNYYSFMMRQLQCYPKDNRHTYKDYLIMDVMNDVFTYFPYHIVVVICAFFLNTAFAIIWNFMDYFIMAVSLSLTTRFEQFALRVEHLSGCFIPDPLWNQIRCHHIMLCEFMEIINDHMATLVLMSCLNNMYFICNNLLNIFTKLRYPINYVYFWTSLLFLLSRTTFVYIFAAKIYDASVKPLKTLYLVPSGCWTEEVQRFKAQILNQSLGLTGKHFYTLTKQGLFGMMATIVTYEFMLLQLDAKNREAGLPELCTN